MAALGELLAPARCLACGRRAPLPWCPACAVQVRTLPAGCVRCGHPPGAGHACWVRGAPIGTTIALYDYAGPVSRAVVAAKLRGARAGWAPLGAALGGRLAASGVDVDAVTYVTTPPARVRARGFDHAELLARGVARALGLPLIRMLEATRRADGQGYRARGALPGSDLVLVDDVLTTGVTAWRAAAALRRADGGEVTLGVLARAGHHPLGVAPRGPAPQRRRTGGRAATRSRMSSPRPVPGARS